MHRRDLQSVASIESATCIHYVKQQTKKLKTKLLAIQNKQKIKYNVEQPYVQSNFWLTPIFQSVPPLCV